ncbi:MAG: peptide/nickel transport system permease protein, partial [Marinomonas primoryensis]
MKYPKKDLIHPISGSRWNHIWSGFVGDKLAVLALIIFIFYVLVALLAPLVAPFDIADPAFMDLMNAEIAPSWISGDSRFLLGTDAQGRDLLSVILYGTRLSLTIGICAVLIQATLGICIGLVSGYLGGR